MITRIDRALLLFERAVKALEALVYALEHGAGGGWK